MSVCRAAVLGVADDDVVLDMLPVSVSLPGRPSRRCRSRDAVCG
jgi:hypothetical protein